MRLDPNSLLTNVLVTVFVAAMVFLLPWADRRICRRLGLNLNGGVSENPRADGLLQLRQGLLTAIFGLYALVVVWLVLLSRSEAPEYLVHIALFQDLHNAISVDFGVLDIFRLIFTEGIGGALSHVRIVKPEDIAQAYMNLMLFVPMGYLLPYVFSWFRQKPRIRPVMACLVISLLIENVQLITRRGFYDVDDLISNTLGGLIGQYLFISVAYVVTHPAWRKELKSYRRWKKNARERTLYPFARRIALSRTTLLATNEEEIWDFYVTKLGFRPRKQLVPEDSAGTDFLLEMGASQVEIRCSNRQEALKTQYLTISAKRLKAIRKRLERNGIPTGPFGQDPYTGQRMLQFSGPDGVKITVLEK